MNLEGAAVVINLDVQCDKDRCVHVHLVGEAILAGPEAEAIRPPNFSPITSTDVTSLDSFCKFLATVTQGAANDTTVDVVGFDPDLVKIPALLDAKEPVSNPISVTLSQS
jgi:hypothetical protein